MAHVIEDFVFPFRPWHNLPPVPPAIPLTLDDCWKMDEAINLDGMFPEELDVIAQDENQPEGYRRYAARKAVAMRARAEGRIWSATIEEASCERIYCLIISAGSVPN